MRPLFTRAELASGLTPDELLESVDVMDLVEAEPDELAKMLPHELDAKRTALRTALVEQSPVLRDLLAVGFRVKSLWFLASDPKSKEDAIPVLIKHLQGDVSAKVKTLLAKQLHGHAPAYSWDVLKAEFLISDKDSHLAEALAFAMAAAAAKKGHEDELIELIRDPKNGIYRSAFLRPLWRLRTERAREVVRDAVNDPQLQAEATAILKGRSPSNA